MWSKGWRDQVWDAFGEPWDLVIIGGGITGAGILREAARAGLRSLLLEAGDFACGTSSRSSKLVHGGFRYLRSGQIGITVKSVRERERLLREGQGLIVRMGFLLASYANDRIPVWMFGLGLSIYDLLALDWAHRRYDSQGLLERCPFLRSEGLLGGYRYFDARTDDARLVLRLLREAVRAGGLALNYAPVVGLLRNQRGEVCGVQVEDQASTAGSRQAEVRARVVINATGVWADEMLAGLAHPPRLRHLRGSHFLFPAHRLPLSRAVSWLHPQDQRPVFAFPWEGVTLYGTTDVDFREPVCRDPAIATQEVDYLIAGLTHAFPSLDLTPSDVQATFSGFRAVIDTGKPHPSMEPREHAVWEEAGLLTVTGGKLTTFRLMAHDALRAAWRRLPARHYHRRQRVLDAPPPMEALPQDLSQGDRLRLLGRYGGEAPAVLACARPGELSPVGDSPVLWVELRWAARAEGVVHLEDLLLRRVRLGLTLPGHGLKQIDRLEDILRQELVWDAERWAREVTAYRRLIRSSYQLPG